MRYIALFTLMISFIFVAKEVVFAQPDTLRANLTSKFCEERISRAFQHDKRIDSISADYKSGNVLIYYKKAPNTDEISKVKDVISNLGYKLIEDNNQTSNKPKYRECCSGDSLRVR